MLTHKRGKGWGRSCIKLSYKPLHLYIGIFTEIMERISQELSIKGVPIKVHGISTGLISLKEKAVNVKNPGMLSLLPTFFSKKFAPMMPIWCWLVEHPEANILIDLGETSKVHDEGYFRVLDAVSSYYFRTQMKFDVKREDELDVQLKELGFAPADIDRIILTHLHLDHTGCLEYFLNHSIEVNKLENEKPEGVFPQLFPEGFSPLYVELDEDYEIFGKCRYLTEDKSMLMLPTPGHSYGHSSILLKTDQGEILFAGDAVYYEEQLAADRFSATVANKEMSIASIAKIKEYARKHKMVFLPSHDQDARRKLEAMEYLEA